MLVDGTARTDGPCAGTENLLVQDLATDTDHQVQVEARTAAGTARSATRTVRTWPEPQAVLTKVPFWEAESRCTSLYCAWTAVEVSHLVPNEEYRVVFWEHDPDTSADREVKTRRVHTDGTGAALLAAGPDPDGEGGPPPDFGGFYCFRYLHYWVRVHGPGLAADGLESNRFRPWGTDVVNPFCTTQCDQTL